MSGRALRIAASAGLVLAACASKKRVPPATGDAAGASAVGGGAPADPPVDPAWRVGCRAALTATSTTAPEHRLARLIAACPVCEVDFGPVLRTLDVGEYGVVGTDPLRVERVLKQCGLPCPGSGRDQFLAALGNISVRAPHRPWRVLADQCPKVLAAGAERLASAPWYVLGQLARVVGAASTGADALTLPASIALPAPAWTANGVGVGLVPAAHLVPALPGALITITDKQTMVGVAPWIVWSSAGLALSPPLEAYPGATVELAALPTAVAAAQPGPPGAADATPPGPTTLIAPRGLPLTRVREVVAALPEGAYLGAVATTRTELAWPDLTRAIAVRITAPVRATDGVVLGLADGGRAGQRGGARVTGCALPAGGAGEPDDAGRAARVAALVARVPAGTTAVSLDPDAGDVATLGALADALAGRGVTELTLTAVRWPAPLPPCAP